MLEGSYSIDIASSFGQLNYQSWIANAYLLTNTTFLPAYGQIADVFGRHAVIQSAILIFLIGSALCTGSQTWGMMLAGRGIAGVGGTSERLAYRNTDVNSRRMFSHDKNYHE
jgi:MFS family permease